MEKSENKSSIIYANNQTIQMQLGASTVTLTFTGKSTENTRAKLVSLLSEAYTERVKKWQ